MDNLLIHKPDRVGVLLRQFERVGQEVIKAGQLREKTLELQAQAAGNEGLVNAINIHIVGNLNTLSNIINEIKDELDVPKYSAHP